MRHPPFAESPVFMRDSVQTRPMTCRNVGTALAAAGLPERMRLHDLRHPCASILQSAGVPIEHISKQLRHKDVVVTQAIDAHVFDTDTANLMDTVAASPSTADKASVTRLA